MIDESIILIVGTVFLGDVSSQTRPKNTTDSLKKTNKKEESERWCDMKILELTRSTLKNMGLARQTMILHVLFVF